MAVKKATEIPTIDVNLVTIQEQGTDGTVTGDEYILDTASQIEVEPQIEEEDGVKLIIKGVLKAQKPSTSTLTGNQITLTDNVFTPELVQMLQGGVVTTGTDGTVTGYTPPVAGSNEKGKIFTLNAYSAQYNAAGIIVRYEKISYPNCQGVPIAFGSEDGTFRAPEYTINSAPNIGQAPYEITYVNELPAPAVTPVTP